MNLLGRDIPKLLLVQPPFTLLRDEAKGCEVPLGLGYLAAVMERRIQVRVLDAVAEGYAKEVGVARESFTYGLSDQAIRAVIAEYTPDVVGVSCPFSTQWRNAHRVCRLAKEVSLETITVMGGAHPSATPTQTLADPNIDYVILGEGEQVFPQLIESLQTGQVACVAGIAFRDGEAIRINPRNAFINNLDALPFPARHLLPMSKYFAINRPHGTMSRFSPNTSIITSRGCPARCVFCSIHNIWGRKFRARSPGNVLDELEQLEGDYGVREVHFEDDNLTYDRARALQIFNGMVARGLHLAWAAPNGLAIHTLDEQLLQAMKASGCYRLHLAIESGDPDVLQRIIRKPLRLEGVPPIVAAARRLGLEVDAFFVVGLPGETREQIRRTFEFADRLHADHTSFFIATPYPGTDLEQLCRAKGYVSPDLSFENLRVRRGNISTPEFTGTELEQMVSSQLLKLTARQVFQPQVFFDRVVLRAWRDPQWAIGHGTRFARQWLRRQGWGGLFTR
jgi:magnesium-protoporphyrin IX monomethyl ester (oxidative) cyclase